MDGGYVRVYKWLDVLNKEITLTYNGKDMLTLAHKGGLTTTSVKLYKDDILYHTFGASETSVVIAEAGVYQAIADDKYYSLKVTVTTITETLARLYLNRFACFLIKKDGKVWYWGESNYGTNAMGNNTQVALPTLNDNLNALPSGIKQIGHCGTDAHASCAITNDGKLYTWGYNGHGQLGRGNSSDYTSQAPLLVATQSSNTFTFCHSSYYNNYALQDNGYVWVTGHGGHYINGLGNNSNINTFTRINLPNVIDIHANHNIALALTSDNEVYIWGTESNSSMGGVSGTTATPTHMTALDGKNIVKVRTGGYTGHAISSDGKMYSWGKGQYRAVPDGTTNNVGTPTEMTWFSRKNIKLVDAQFPYDEAAACLGLDDQGNMYVWGTADHGVMGDGPDMPTYSWPIHLRENIASITVGRHSCGCIDKFGQVYTWGDGLAGQQNWIHGTNSDTDINIPTSNNLSVGSSVVYDGFDKYLLGKDSTVTSNVTFGSNTVSLGTKSEVFISDPHTYKFKIMESGKTTYTSNVISSTPTRPTGRVYPPKSGTHKNHTARSTSANTDFSWNIDGALYGSGDYTASCSKALHSNNAGPFECFNGLIDKTSCHLNTGQTAPFDIQLHMPQKIKLTKYAMYNRSYTGEYNHSPKDWKVYGSNDKTNWTELDSQTNQTVTAWGSQLDLRDTKREYTVTGNTKYFSSYKLDISATGTSTYGIISQIEYYGDEEGFLSDDGFGKLTLDVKGDTSATSNIVFHSNTYVMGAARDLYITDTGEYTADIFGSNKHFLGSKTHTVSANATELVWKENEDQILYASDAAASDHFGTSVAIRGDYAISSSYSDDGEKGSAYIFYKSGGTWTQQTKLVASDAAGSDRFGWSVAIDGDYAIIGSVLDDDPTDSGSAYIFKRSGTTWTQQAKLTASDAQASDDFGYSVAISGDYAIVGAWNEDTGGTDAGAAYVFKGTTTTSSTVSEHPPSALTGTQTGGGGGYTVTSSSDAYNNTGFYNWKLYNKILINEGWHTSAIFNSTSPHNYSGSASLGGVSGEWNKLEFPAPFVCDYVILYSRDASSPQKPDDWVILGSNDDSNWTQLVTTTTVPTTSGLTVQISDTNSYKYFAIVIKSTHSSQYCSIGELKYFGYMPSLTTWSQQQKILSSDIGAGDQFGISVDIDGEYTIIGANYEDTGGSNAGAAYIFKRETTSLNTVGHAIPDEHTSYYGASDWICQSVSGTVGIYKHIYRTGTPVDSGLNTLQYDSSTSTWSDHGAHTPVYLSKNSASNSNTTSVSGVNEGDVIRGWNTTAQRGQFTQPASGNIEIWPQQQKILSSDIEANDQFGRSVSLSGDYTIVSAHLEDTGATSVGAAYVYKRDGTTWTQEFKFQASDKQDSDKFGESVSISGNRVVVGANLEDTGGSNAGAAYIFERSGTTWTEVKKITASGAGADDYFGQTVAIDGTNVIVGARSEDTKGSNAGAAYIFSKAAKAVPALNFDGYNKLSIDNINEIYKRDTFEYTFEMQHQHSGAEIAIHEIYAYDSDNNQITITNIINGDATFNGSSRGPDKAYDGNVSGTLYQFADSGNTWYTGIKLFTLTTNSLVYKFDFRHHRPVYKPGYNIKYDGVSIYSDTSNGGGSTTPEYASTIYILGSHSASSFTMESVTVKKDGAAFATTTSNTVYIRDTGTYTAEVKGSGAYVTELSKVVSGSISGQNASNALIGSSASCFYVVTHDGKAYSSGRNNSGQLGDGTTTNRNTFTHISSLTNVVNIDGSTDTVAACLSDGTVYAWGDNYYGQLGQGNTTNSSTPLQVKGVGGSGYLTNISAASGGHGTMFYVTSAGDLYACGLSANGELGQGNTSNSSTPLQVKGVGGTGYLTNIIRATGASKAAIALSSTGTVYTWGANSNGQAGVGNTTEYHTPQIMQDTTGSSNLTNIVKLGSTNGGFHVVLSSLASGGHVYGAGYNGYGQLGDNSTSNRSTVVQMKGVGGTGFMENIVDVDTGGHSTVICDSSGYVYCVGYNGQGQLGQGNTTNSSTPLKVKGVGGTGYLENIIKVQCDDTTCLALSSTGKLYGWGRNNFGNLGDGTETQRTTPIEVPFTLFTSSPSVTYDGKNKLTVGGTNYEDTSTVTYYSNTYNLGTAKTMYVKDIGDYVFKISGTDKYVESNVHVSSVDLAGATTKPISFDGYNKLTLISPGENAVSNVTYFSNTYDMGSASTFYIKDTGTYDLEMSGSNVFALSSNVVGSITSELEWKSNENQIVYASDGAANDQFGNFVSVDGNYAIVGAIGGIAAYIFYKSGGTWTQQAILTGNDTVSGDEFGTCVSIKGDYAVVAARGHNTYAGAAYVFVRSGTNWTQQQKLTASDAASNDKLATCSIDGDYIILGAWGKSSGTGAVYIFKRSGTSWSQQQKITASNAGSNDLFGSAISLNGDYAVISAWSEDTAGTNAGSAYIFKRGAGTETWTEEAIIRGDTIDADDRLGDRPTSASISGDYAIVGARYQDTGGSNRGSAYIFVRSGTTWTQQAQLQPSDTADSDHFGYSVSINGSMVVVGTADKDSGKGAAYIFERSGTTWTEVKKITASDAENNDVFGCSVAIDGTTIFVGACAEDTKGSAAGAAYIFSKGAKAVPSLTFDNYNKLTVSNFNSTSNEWPPPRPWTTPATTTDSDTTGITGSNSGKDATWTISGAAYGNGVYSATCDTVILNSATNHGPWKLFSKTNINYGFHTSSVSTCKIELTMPESIVLGSYEIFHRGDSTVSDNNYPKDWTIEGSNDGTTWTVLDTRTNETYSDTSLSGVNSGRKYTVSGNSTSYNRYRMDITANNGGTHVIMGEWKLFASNPRTGTLTDPNGSTYALGQTQDTIYINQTGDYTLDVTNNDQKAIVAKTVGTVSSGIVSNPVFTSATVITTDTNWASGSGWEITADSTNNSTTKPGWKAFDNTWETSNEQNMWHSAETATSTSSPKWLKIKYPSAYKAIQYSIQIRDLSYPRYPKTWKFQGSNNDSDWTDLDTQTNKTDWAGNNTVMFTFSNSTAYQYYRVYITATDTSDSDGGCCIRELKVYTSATGSQVGNLPVPGYTYPNTVTVDSALSGTSITIANDSHQVSGGKWYTLNHSTYAANRFIFWDNAIGYWSYFDTQGNRPDRSWGNSGGTPGRFNIETDGDLKLFHGSNGSTMMHIKPNSSSNPWPSISGSPSLTFDNSNKLTVANVDSDATSNIDFFSNTYEMGSRKELIINDAGAYYANIYSSNTLALVKKQVTTVDSNPTGTYNTISNIDGTGNSLGRSHIGHPISFNAAGTRVVIGEELSYKAFVYDKVGSSWTLSQTWTTPDNHGFGNSCVMSDDGNVVVVVENDSSNNRMSLFVYENGSWVTKQNRTETSGARDTFGAGLFMSGDGEHLLVTDYSYEGSGGKGRVKIFDISGYSFIERLNVGYSTTAYNMRGDIDRYGNRAIWEDDAADYFRVYKRSGTSWSQSTTIAPSNTSGRGAVSCDENMVRVSISDIVNSSAGVTIWYRNPSGDTFALEQTITVDNAETITSMNYAGDRVMITDKTAGDIEIWTRSGTTWTKQKTINPPTFGTLVNYSHTSNKGDGYTLAITDQTYDSNKGRVYIYSDPSSGPSLTFDGYNKLTAPVLEASFTATRLSDWDNSNQSKTNNFGTGDWPETTAGMTNWWTLQNNDKVYDNLWKTTASGEPLRDPAQLFTTVTSSDWAYGAHTDGGQNASSIWRVGYKFTAGSKKVGSMKIWQACANHPMGDMTIKYWDGTSLKTVTNQSPSGFPSSISYYTEQEFTFDVVSSQYWMFETKAHTSSPNNSYIGSAGWQLLSGRDPVSTVLTKGSDSWDVGTASNVYIDAAGTYDAQAKNSNTFIIKTSNVVSGSITRSQVWNATESQILLADDRDTNTQLGYGCDIDGDYIIGGGPQDDEGGSAAGAAYIFKKTGTSWTQTAKLMASDPNTNDQFGEFCEISGDYAIVGNYQEDAGGTSAGAAYIYKRDTGAETWTQQAKLMASNAGSSDFFGRGVSIDGDYAIVGAPYEDTGGDGAGAAYIFKRSGASWSQQAIILASDAASADEYGWDVSISGDYAVVGARQEDEGGSNAGAAYIFKYDATYPPDDLPPVDSVGTGFNYKRYTALDTSTHYVYKMWRNSASDWRTPSPASANTIKVLKTDSTDWSDNDTTDTNPEYVDTTTYSGKVSLGQSGPTENYRFSVPTFGRWSQQQKLIGESAGNYFGNAVAIDGDYLAVGAQYEATTATGGGAVYIFKRDGTTWTQQAKLLPSDGQANDELTIEGSLSISGDIVIAGARNSDPGGISNAGAAYVWERSGTTWTETKKFISNKHITTSGRFANSVGVSGDTVVVGAGYEDVDGVTHAGALHVFDKVYVGPTLTYDNSNKLSLTGVTTPSTNLTVGTNTYDIGSAKDVYIKDQGTYTFHTNDGNQALILNKTVSSDPSGGGGVGPDIPLAFHHGTFANGGDPYSHGSVAAAATAGYVYSDTPTGTYTWGTLSSVTLTAGPGDLEPTSGGSPGTAGKTEYKWTPISAITNGRTLVVAGGGGGGADMGGGGGAGGLLASTTTNIAKEEQTITVGDGGTRGLSAGGSNITRGGNGADSSISGASITAIGGGGGATAHNINNHPAGNGGSGGGGSGGRVSNGNYGGERGTGTVGQGFDGARSGTTWYPGGGGGASEKGYGRDGTGGQNVQPHGGDGLENDILGTSYWFAGGGGGASHSNHGSLVAGHGGKGGGGGGAHHNQTNNPTNDTNGLTTGEIPTGSSGSNKNSGGSGGKHTGGGGGGGEHSSNSDTTKMRGGRGGSGIVVIVAPTVALTPPSQVYDNTKTITVSNIPSGTSTVGKIYKGATAYTIHATEPTSNVIIKNTGSYVSVFTTSSSAYLTNTVNVNATPTTTSDDNTIEDAAPIVTTTVSGASTIVAFHHGTFVSGEYGYTDVATASAAGFVYANTQRGTYAWGELTANTLTTSNTAYTWTPTADITAEMLMVAGGGGGGGTSYHGGGGGAGGVITQGNLTISGQQSITVGNGSPGYNLGLRGYNSVFNDLTAIGGGAGGASDNTGYSGGSGGGSGVRQPTNAGGAGTSGQGNNGGGGYYTSGSVYAASGGGGAGSVGENGSNTKGGDGGAGISSNITGTLKYYAGGGGGSVYNSTASGLGGVGGGGDGTYGSGGGNGEKHTGGGGGGRDSRGSYNKGSGNGGSGIVIIKYVVTTTTGGIAGSTAVPSASSSTTDAPSTVLVATTEVAAPTLNLDFTANMSTFPRNLKRYNGLTNSSIGARFNRTHSKKKRVHKSINTDKFSIELTANNMGDSSSSTSTLPVTVVNSGAGTQYTSGWTTTGSTSSFVVPSDAPNALYYYCQNHDGMGGSISVSSASTTTHTVTVVSSSAGTQYTSGWTASGTPGSSGGINTFIAPSNAPSTLYYYCGNHSGMGGAINMVSGPVSTTFAVTVQSVSGYYGSSNKYFIDGTQQATISLVRGKTYTFNNNASGSHPMYITTSSDGTIYTSGVTNGGTSSVTFAVPLNAPTTLYYKCGVHGGMGGTIHILGPTASPLAVTVAGGKFVIGGVSQATLQLVRGETYVFNQENSTNGTHPLRLSTTSNGTHVSGGSGFYIGGTQRPTLSMVRGNTYTFDQTNASNGSHVLQIATASDGTQYTSGYTTGTFVVPLSAPDTLYYKSSTTSGMGGLINVTGSTTSAFVVTASGGNFSIGGVEQASLSVIRGLTYTFNQISGHVLSLSSTSDGTRNTGVNKYYISGVETPTLTFIRGSTYTFTQATSTNTNHPIRLSTTSNGTHASGSQYTSGWTTTGTPGSSGASSQFIVPADAPNTLYYYCQHHSGMGGASSINVADSNSGIILTYGTHALVANSTVSGEYTIATNFDGTTSNLYVNGDLISQTTPTIASGAKMIKIGEDYNGLIKNLKFWNYAKSFLVTFTKVVFHYGSFDSVYGDADVNAAAAAGHVFDNTPAGTYPWGTITLPSTASNQTTYTWTLSGTITADVLMVAGGGGGGGSHGGGGGAGGLLFNESVSLSGQKTITVGNGGVGGIGYANGALELGTNGVDTTFTNLTTTIGGGGGGGDSAGTHRTGNNGASGGGSGYHGTGGSGLSGQGYGGGSSNGDGASGGGGANGVGSGNTGNSGGNGGAGYLSTFGSTYGDGGYFASGGGGSARSSNTQGVASLGGGSDGNNGSVKSDDAQKHTGGGGGGAHYAGSTTALMGGSGGSGIVIVMLS